MRRLFFLIISLSFFHASFAASALTMVSDTTAVTPRNADGTYPVWVSPDLGVKSLSAEDINAALERKFWDNPIYRKDFPAEVSYLQQHQNQDVIPTNCLDMVKLFQIGQLIDSGWDVSYKKDDTLQNAPPKISDFLTQAWSYCQANRLLKRVKPAKVSYLHNLVFDKNLPDILPAGLVPNDYACIYNYIYSDVGGVYTENSLFSPKSQKLSWQEYYRVNEPGEISEDGTYNEMRFLYTKPAEAGMTFATKDYNPDDEKATQTKLFLLAKGDFNNSGLESMLVMSTVHRHEIKDQDAEQKSSGLYLLTRKNLHSVLRVLYPENYMDRTYRTSNKIRCDARFNKLLSDVQ